jgi:phage portal protein BeeE
MYPAIACGVSPILIQILAGMLFSNEQSRQVTFYYPAMACGVSPMNSNPGIRNALFK